MSIKTDSSVHVDGMDLSIHTNNREKDKYFDAYSTMYVTYKDDTGKVVLFLSRPQAKELAEGILSKIDEMKYD